MSATATREYFLGFRKTHRDAFLPEIGLQTGAPNLSAGVDMKSLFNYEIPPRGGRCEVQTGVALEFVTSLKNKIETLKRLNETTAEYGEAHTPPLSSVLSPKRSSSSTCPAKKKKVNFTDPLEADLNVLNVKDERGVVMVRSRSGMAWKHKINVLTFYTSLEMDEIVIGVVNYGPEAFILKAGDRFAQLIVHSDDAEGFVDLITTEGPTMSDANYNGLCAMPVFKNNKEEVKISPGESRLINTENVIAMRGSDAVYMQLQGLPEASQGLMYADVHAGVIDGDYRGKVGVVIHNDGNDEIVVPAGQDVAVGMIYKICCPVGEVCEVLCPVALDRDKEELEASDVFFSLGDRMMMLEANDVSRGEGKRVFHIMKKSEEELVTEEGKRYVVRTGICLKTEELKKKGLVLHVRATYDDDMVYGSGAKGWKVDNATGEIILLMKGGDGKVYVKDDVLAEIQLLRTGTKNGEGPRLVDSGADRVEEAGGRGDKGFGSTGM